MPTIPEGFNLSDEVTTLTTLVLVERKDGVRLGFTTHDQDIEHNGVLFEARSAANPSEIQFSGAFKVDNANIGGVLSSDRITENDLRAGRYEDARVDMMLIDWADPSKGVINIGRYFMGPIQFVDEQYKIDLLSFKELLQKELGDYITMRCRVDFCSAPCGLKREDHTIIGSIGEVIAPDELILNAADGRDENYWQYGLIKILGGDNEGLIRDIKESDEDGRIHLWEPFPFLPQAGEMYQMIAGCDKTLETCRDRYDNVVNFRGFPTVPGSMNVLKYPDAKG